MFDNIVGTYESFNSFFLKVAELVSQVGVVVALNSLVNDNQRRRQLHRKLCSKCRTLTLSGLERNQGPVQTSLRP